jgi:hypothetical protein
MLLCGGGRLLVTIALSTLIESGCPFSHRATKEDESSIVRSLSASGYYSCTYIIALIQQLLKIAEFFNSVTHIYNRAQTT